MITRHVFGPNQNKLMIFKVKSSIRPPGGSMRLWEKIKEGVGFFSGLALLLFVSRIEST